MGRTVVRRAEPSRNRRTMDWLLLAGGALVLVFALIGVVSAGAYVGSKLGGANTKQHNHQPTTTQSGSVAVQDIARAQAQATAIVKAAQDAGHAIVSGATKKAHRQAAAIVSHARTKASTSGTGAAGGATTSTQAGTGTSSQTSTSTGTTTSGSTTTGATSGSTSTGASGTSTGTGTTSYGSGSTAAGVAGTTSSGTSTGTTGTTAPQAGAAASVPDLSGVPASWLVVGYNATFGTGPGNVGSISVYNRSGKTMSGVATVVYQGASGGLGSASAPFSSLAPGQSEVLALNGTPYPAGATGYHIQVNVS